MSMRKAIQVCTTIGGPLREEIRKAASAEGMKSNEWISRACALALGRPDLVEVPRHKRGRPFKVKPMDVASIPKRKRGRPRKDTAARP